MTTAQRSKLFSFLILLAAALLQACASPVWQKVDMAKRQGKLDAAAAMLEAHLRKHPLDARAHYTLGEIRAAMDDYRGMLAAFDACERADSRWKRETAAAREYYWLTNFNGGLKALQLKQLALARKHFEFATIILPQRSEAHRLFGETLIAQQDTALARTAFLNALDLNDQDHRARRFLCMIYFAAGDYKPAVQEAAKLLSVFPNDVEALRIRAYSFDRLDEYEAARQAYAELLAAGGNAEDIESFAALQYRRGDYHHAEDLSRQALAKGGDLRVNLNAIAQCQLMQQDFRGLSETARRMLELNEYDLVALQLLQLSFAGLGAAREAEGVQEQINRITHKQP